MESQGYDTSVSNVFIRNSSVWVFLLLLGFCLVLKKNASKDKISLHFQFKTQGHC